jgi:hypothetical protein
MRAQGSSQKKSVDINEKRLYFTFASVVADKASPRVIFRSS